MSRWAPEYASATRMMAVPNEPVTPRGSSGTVRFSGRIPSDGRLTINDTTAGVSLVTGAWAGVNDPSTRSYAASFRLSVDGNEVARKDIAIPLQ